MPFIEAAEIERDTVVEADVCIVGAGAAGIAFAHSLRGTPVRVCVLESGGFSEEPELQALNIGENIGIDDVPLETARYRLFGGTTHRWTGWCRPLDEVDFERRPWVRHSGWPVTRAELEPYYRRAQELCQISGYTYEAEGWGDAIHPLYRQPFADGDIRTVVFQGSPPTKFGNVYRRDFATAVNVSIYLHATAVEVETNEAGREVTQVRVANLEGGSFRVRARAFVLTAGGIETPRLLLASTAVQATGIGNQHDNVGRYFMQHPHVLSGHIILSRSGTVDRPRIPAIDSGITGLRDRLVFQRPVAATKCAYSLRAEAQERFGLLNYSAHLSTIGEHATETPSYHSLKLIIGNARSPRRLLWQIRHRALPAGLGEHLKSVVRNVDEVARVLYEEILRRPHRLAIHTQSEQAPEPESRVTLSRERDALGVPRVRLDWRLSLLDKQSLRQAQELVGRQLERSGVGHLDPAPWLRNDDADWGPRLHGGFHHLGTARMSENAKDGVVDRNCRVHGMTNLYVADSSVFPTGGYANPTLTIVAIAMRAADHIRETLRSGAPIEKPRLAASLPDAANALDGSRRETAPLSTPRAGGGQP